LELLTEQRTALISRAVTRGLSGIVSRGDAEFAEWGKRIVKYKPSGVEWLGDVPEHWEVKKLKWAYQGIGSGDGISPDDIKPNGTYPVYGGNGIMGYTESYNSNSTDIIIGRVGAKCGNVYIVDGSKWISDNALKLKINRVILKYLALVLEKRNLNQLANQNAQPLITGSMVGNQFIPFPPLSEQQAIAAFLDRETAKIDALSAKVVTVIERLKEYRTALISSAVTGKIDVREAI
jgi:type I restriction enzyme S subunit